MLLTTPESLSLLLSHEDSALLFEGLSTIVVDEVHAFAAGKRGDLLNLAMARLQTLAPNLRRVALSATVADPEAYQGWLAPHADIETVDVVLGDPGAEPQVGIMLPDDEKIPWSGPLRPLGGAECDAGDRAAPDHPRLLQHPAASPN